MILLEIVMQEVKLSLLKVQRAKKGISPILATLLLIVIAVGTIMITYAWVVTFTTTQTQQAGAVLVLENVRFHESASGAKNRTDITIRNTGTADGKIVAVYWSSSSFADLKKLTATTDYTLDPTSGVVSSLSSVKITVLWGAGGGTGGAWASGKTYYFKVVTEAGSFLEFPAKAP